jgi:putative ABC transport system ATP-binding protein
MSDAPTPPAVDVRGVTRLYPGNVTALSGVDLAVRFGESVAITGPSGCGKSTLLHMLAAIDKPSAGHVSVFGRDLATMRDLTRYRRYEVGLVFQLHNLLPQLPVLTNVELPMFGTRSSERERRARARELLAHVDLSGREHRRPTELSGGERQRVAIARALANSPRLLLADEPTGSLDSASTTRVLELFRRVRSEGVTILMVTHDHEVAATADRIVLMEDGRVVDDGRPDVGSVSPDGTSERRTRARIV